MQRELGEQQLRQLFDAEDALFHRILDVGKAIGDVVGGLHHVGQRVTRARLQIERRLQRTHEGFLGQIEAGLLQQVGAWRAFRGLGLIGRTDVLEQSGGLRIGQVEALQRDHQANRLGIAFEVLEIDQHPFAQLGIALPRRHGGREQPVEIALEPLADGVLAEMAERRIADIVHQAGHLDQALQRRLESVQAELRGAVAELLVQGANDEAAGLLHFQRMGEAAAHRGIALQRKHLRLLLQAAHRGRVDDAPAIALQLVQHGVEAAIAGPQARLGLAIGALAGDFVLEVHGHRHASFSRRKKNSHRA